MADLRHTNLSMHLRILHYVSGTAAEAGTRIIEENIDKGFWLVRFFYSVVAIRF